MANKKKNKYPQSQIRARASRYVIKGGEYNGAEDSSAFMVSGHSTGSPYSEMEEISEQLTRDVGGRPYQPVEFANDQGETGYDDYQGEGLGDLGGPEFYGDKPSLLKKSPIHHAGTSRGLAIGAAVALGATALLGGLAYFFRQAGASKPTTHARDARNFNSASRGASRKTTAARVKSAKASVTSTASKRRPKTKRESRSQDSASAAAMVSAKPIAKQGGHTRASSRI